MIDYKQIGQLIQGAYKIQPNRLGDEKVEEIIRKFNNIQDINKSYDKLGDIVLEVTGQVGNFSTGGLDMSDTNYKYQQILLLLNK